MSDASDIRQSSVSSAPSKKTLSLSFNSQTVIKIVGVILIAILAFWLGVAYGDHKTKENLSSSAITSGSGSFGFRTNGGFGTVSAISASSITVDNSRTGATKTYAITSSTKITDSGQTATTSSISDGDRVIVIPSSSNSSNAGEIVVNPGFGGATSSGSSSGSITNGSTTTQ